MRVKEFKEVITTENIHREYITVDGIKYATLSMADSHENKCFRAKERYLRLHRIAPEIYTVHHLKEIFGAMKIIVIVGLLLLEKIMKTFLLVNGVCAKQLEF